MRTLYQSGKLARTIRDMHSYRLCLLGVQEARWTGSGNSTLTTGDTMLWSGRQGINHQEGVALITNKETSSALLDWKPVSERLLYARQNSRAGLHQSDMLPRWHPVGANCHGSQKVSLPVVQLHDPKLLPQHCYPIGSVWKHLTKAGCHPKQWRR